MRRRPRPGRWWEISTPSTQGLRGRGDVLAGVHDSNANFLRYLAGGQSHFSLLSTGTWVIGFDTDADMLKLDHARDIVANKSVFGKTVASCRFFGGKEFEVAGWRCDRVTRQAWQCRPRSSSPKALMPCPPSPIPVAPCPAPGGKGRIIGAAPKASLEEKASLATLYCALMVSESLDAMHSAHTVIVDGPFSQNNCLPHASLQALRPDSNPSWPLKPAMARQQVQPALP